MGSDATNREKSTVLLGSVHSVLLPLDYWRLGRHFSGKCCSSMGSRLNSIGLYLLLQLYSRTNLLRYCLGDPVDTSEDQDCCHRQKYLQYCESPLQTTQQRHQANVH